MDENQFRILIRTLETMARALQHIAQLVEKIEERIPADPFGMEATDAKR